MTSIRGGTSIIELAAIVSGVLEAAGITAVLSGGAAVSIYTNNRYQSLDLDFVSSEQMSKLAAILEPHGFVRGKGRYLEHADTDLYVEFPPGPLAVGGSIITKWSSLETEYGSIQVLTPTQMVMDRLAAFFHWNDPQALDQAVLIAQDNPIDWPAVEAWAAQEDASEKYQTFKRAFERA